MAGLISDALPGVIDSKTHGIIDYIHAGTNILAGFLFAAAAAAPQTHALRSEPQCW